jgi:hypothetical protein
VPGRPFHPFSSVALAFTFELNSDLSRDCERSLKTFSSSLSPLCDEDGSRPKRTRSFLAPQTLLLHALLLDTHTLFLDFRHPPHTCSRRPHSRIGLSIAAEDQFYRYQPGYPGGHCQELVRFFRGTFLKEQKLTSAL